MMTIVEAKKQIKDAVEAYLLKDQFGNYVIPLKNQRPIFLNGAPGMGKTDIMAQISAELKIGLVPYSMTHHTRQSAIGLPFIEKRKFGNKEYNYSEYTMSEIIASVHKQIEESGYKEGILFLDEVNCVSETLAPAMLCFLQYKKFGEHVLPDGWIIVTAGNASQDQNKSMRDFDIVTWDRLKRIDVVPDFDCWKPYAYEHGVHSAIMSFLEAKREACFHVMEKKVEGKQFVTARGWTDLSEMMKTYERLNKPVTGMLISQYIQHNKIAVEFTTYYNLWLQYKSDYKIGDILAGENPKDILSRVKRSDFEKGLAFIGLLCDMLFSHLRDYHKDAQTAVMMLDSLKKIKLGVTVSSGDVKSMLIDELENLKNKLKRDKLASAITIDDEYSHNNAIFRLNEMLDLLNIKEPATNKQAFALIKEKYDAFISKHIKDVKEKLVNEITNALEFCNEAFDAGRNMTIFVTNITINNHAVEFLSRNRCDAFDKYIKSLLIYERDQKLRATIEDLDLGDL